MEHVRTSTTTNLSIFLWNQPLRTNRVRTRSTIRHFVSIFLWNHWPRAATGLNPLRVSCFNIPLKSTIVGNIKWWINRLQGVSIFLWNQQDAEKFRGIGRAVGKVSIFLWNQRMTKDSLVIWSGGFQYSFEIIPWLSRYWWCRVGYWMFQYSSEITRSRRTAYEPTDRIIIFQYSSEIIIRRWLRGMIMRSPSYLSFNIPLKSTARLVFVCGFKAFPPCCMGFVRACFCS